MTRVLFVEDDKAIRDLVAFHLELAKYDATSIADGAEALKLAGQRAFDLIVLDVLLPGMDGVTLCQSIRREGINRDAPILMLTARREESDKLLGLKSGADDYVTKPFSVRELLARLEALLRRSNISSRAKRPREQPVISLLGLTIDPERRRVTCDGAIVTLTAYEFSLLYFLASHPGVVFDREELLARVWEAEVYVTNRGVDALVKRLRRKIESDPRHPTRVITVWGTGYKFGEF